MIIARLIKKYLFSFIENASSLQFLGYSQEPLERVKAEIISTDELMTELNLEEILCQEKLKSQRLLSSVRNADST